RLKPRRRRQARPAAAEASGVPGKASVLVNGRLLAQRPYRYALSAIPVQQQQRCAFGGLEQGVVRGVEAARQLIGKTDAQGTQLRDTCRHVWIAEHEHGAVPSARAVKGDVEVIGGQRQVRIGCVQLLGRDRKSVV